MTSFQHYPTLREANAARQELWDPTGRLKNMDWRCNELAGEAGEVCNILKKLQRERLGLPGSRATVEQLAEELADVIICTDLVGMQAGLPAIEFIGPYFSPILFRSLLHGGNMLDMGVGSICGVACNKMPILAHWLDPIVIVVRNIAAQESIGLGRAVEQKFNATSEKVGLPVRLEMTTGAMATG